MVHVLPQCPETDEWNGTVRTGEVFDPTTGWRSAELPLFESGVSQSQVSKKIGQGTETRSTGQTFDEIFIGMNTFQMTEECLFQIKHRRTDGTFPQHFPLEHRTRPSGRTKKSSISSSNLLPTLLPIFSTIILLMSVENFH